MKRPLTTWQINCDFCNKTEVVTKLNNGEPQLPEKWAVIIVRSADKFDSHRDACPNCAKRFPSGEVVW